MYYKSVAQLSTSHTIATTDKRARLIQAAVKLVYQRGFGRASLADIAREAHVPLGNVYYYFKTKDDIGDAIIEHYLSLFHAARDRLGALGSAQERLCAFVQAAVGARELVAESGCPLATLCSELRKETGRLARSSARLFAEPLAWMESQFRELGKAEEARGLAVHLLAALEGIAVLAHALRDPELVVVEIERLKGWIRTL
jgi:TetR/AcrR family transcriptional regulator, transcriptional repressor for nem operon